jgi:hypothetical protein
MNKQFLAMTGALTAVASLSFAIPFDNSSGDPAVATVGPSGADYSSLAAAASAFSSVSGGINREWTLQVTGDLTETAPVYFGNTFGPGGKLIIKPAPSTQPTILFQCTSGPQGIYGDMVFGVTNGNLPTAANDRPSDGNYVIDGSNTVGGTTRDLTLKMEGTNDSNGRVVRVWGDTWNMVIKNTNIIARRTASAATNPSYAIGVAAGQTSDTIPVSRRPNGLTIESCYLESNSALSTYGNAIEFSVTANGQLPAGIGIENVTVRNCTIVSKQRGNLFTGLYSGVIEGNSITITSGTGTGLTYAGIFLSTNNSTPGGTVIVRNNIVDMAQIPSKTAGQGAYGILVDSGMTSATIQIYNNIVKYASDAFTAATGTDLIYRGISFGAATSKGLIEHNSVDCEPNTTAVVSTTAGRVAGIACGVTMGDTLQIRNNIVRTGNASTVARVIYLADATNVTCEGNDLVPNGSPAVGQVGSNVYLALADWQGAGFDSAASGGQSVDPASVNPAWDANLHFALKPVGLATVASSTILTDIDGDARPATGAYPGADEPPGPAAGVADWALF